MGRMCVVGRLGEVRKLVGVRTLGSVRRLD